ncbi:hypothetical protein D3C81_1288590 [compost metagenome]
MSEGVFTMATNWFRFMDYFPNNRCAKLWLGSLTTLWPCVDGLIKKYVEITCNSEERDLIVKCNRHPKTYTLEELPVSSTVAKGLTSALTNYQEECSIVKSDRERLEVFVTPILEATRQVEVLKGLSQGHLQGPLNRYLHDIIDAKG